VAYHELESFSYSVAHDLRAPLRSINGFSHILQDEYAAQFDEAGRRFSFSPYLLQSKLNYGED